MSFYIDGLFESKLDWVPNIRQTAGVDLPIRPGTVELIDALDLIFAYYEQMENLSEKEILTFQEKIISAFDHAIRCDPHHLPTLVFRACIFSHVLAYPHLALHDLNAIYRLRGYDKDIWVIANRQIASAMSDNPVSVNGTPYFAFKIRIDEKDLYYIRSEIYGFLGHEYARIEDLKKAAWLGHEEAIADLK